MVVFEPGLPGSANRNAPVSLSRAAMDPKEYGKSVVVRVDPILAAVNRPFLAALPPVLAIFTTAVTVFRDDESEYVRTRCGGGGGGCCAGFTLINTLALALA